MSHKSHLESFSFTFQAILECAHDPCILMQILFPKYTFYDNVSWIHNFTQIQIHLLIYLHFIYFCFYLSFLFICFSYIRLEIKTHYYWYTKNKIFILNWINNKTVIQLNHSFLSAAKIFYTNINTMAQQNRGCNCKTKAWRFPCICINIKFENEIFRCTAKIYQQ